MGRTVVINRNDWSGVQLGTKIRVIEFLDDDVFCSYPEEAAKLLGQIGIKQKDWYVKFPNYPGTGESGKCTNLKYGTAIAHARIEIVDDPDNNY